MVADVAPHIQDGGANLKVPHDRRQQGQCVKNEYALHRVNGSGDAWVSDNIVEINIEVYGHLLSQFDLGKL